MLRMNSPEDEAREAVAYFERELKALPKDANPDDKENLERCLYRARKDAEPPRWNGQDPDTPADCF